jgi:beta-glucosidase
MDFDQETIRAKYSFPKGFVWGTATSSHQVEGNNRNNNWWMWEQEPGRILNNHTSGIACDWWGGQWRADLDRASENHQNSHRLSIEWSRIQPARGKWDEYAIDQYREIVKGIKLRGMEPFVTLHHFSDPLWFSKSGGWEQQNAADQFASYVAKVVNALADHVKFWVTINEPNVMAVNAYLLGLFPPGKSNSLLTLRVMENLAAAHAAAYHIIHEISPGSQIGFAVYFRGFEPSRSWSPTDRLTTQIHKKIFNDFFPDAFTYGSLNRLAYRKKMPGMKNTLDFLGLNYYTRDLVSFNILRPAEMFSRRFFSDSDVLSESGDIANVPDYFFQAIQWAMKFSKDIYITENGIDDSSDEIRRNYLVQHIHQLWKAVNFNFPVRGYFHWSLIDNFEWERGWSQKFGIWDVDPETQHRRPRDSVALYAAICRENALSTETVSRFAPRVFKRIFPFE